MAIEFTSTVTRGEAKGERMEPWKDEDGCYVLFDPSKRRDGSVKSIDCFRTRSASVAAKMIKERRYSMRMRLCGSRGGAASMIKADRIVMIDISSNE